MGQSNEKLQSFQEIMTTSENLFQAKIQSTKNKIAWTESRLAEKQIELDEQLAQINRKIEEKKKDISVVTALPIPLTKLQRKHKEFLELELHKLQQQLSVHMPATIYESKERLKTLEKVTNELSQLESNLVVKKEVNALRTKHAKNAKGIKTASERDEKKNMVAENRKTLPTYLRIAKNAGRFHKLIQKDSANFDVFEVGDASKTVKFKTDIKTGDVRLCRSGQPVVTTVDPGTREEVTLNAYLHDPEHVIKRVLASFH
jgi:hypothetical protein